MKATQGTVLLLDQPLSNYSSRDLSRSVAVVFQEFSCPYEFTVFDLVALGRNPFLARWKSLSRHDRVVMADIMETTDIIHLSNRLFLELSGGEKQRVIIAKALAQEPSVLLLDEPATHLDVRHQVNVFNILQKLNQEKGVTIFCITHDLNLAAQYISRLLLLREGHLLADGSPKTIITRELLENLFHTPLSVGTVTGTDMHYVYSIGNRININKSS
jgi:iron complex transport system ATP-binding protein